MFFFYIKACEHILLHQIQKISNGEVKRSEPVKL